MKNQDIYAGRYTKYILEKIMITVSNNITDTYALYCVRFSYC